MSINIKNLKPTNSENKTFTPVEEDRYTVTVEAADAIKSKSGADAVNVRMVINSGELTGKTNAGKKLWARLTAEGTAGVYLYRFLESCQSPLVDSDAVTIDIIASDLMGRQLSVYAEPATNNGQPTTNVSQYKPVDTSAAPAAKPAAKPASATSATSGRVDIAASSTKSPWE